MVDNGLLVAIAILFPALTATLCYIVKNSFFRTIIVIFSTFVMFCVAGFFIHAMNLGNGVLSIKLGNNEVIGLLIKFFDFCLLAYVIYIGVKLKKPIIMALSLLQLIPLLIFEFSGIIKEPETSFTIDYLSLVMILLVSIVGPIISVFAIGYMKEHEEHLHLKRSRQARFFAIIFMFLGAMNALVMTNNLLWLYFFWEVTTLCSFLLISHDGNEISIKNAVRALWINSLGGVAFVAAIITLYMKNPDFLDINVLLMGDNGALVPISLAFLCLAGFTKSAQFPFQSWLLGAMVAPTPVSALLHSSTMVKAGVYLVVRLIPAFKGILLFSTSIAVVGAFTFLAGSAIAISQRNGKRVLAYSTIANLGLIICCAGIGNYMAIGAAVLLIIFHALSKGLLFLCVGTIEQGIGSRDIEDMQGLMKKMPFTTVVTVIGMISMLLPPFGVLATKLLSIEASANLPIVLFLIIAGSAFTVVFWAKWIGLVLTMSYKPRIIEEKVSSSIKASLLALLLLVLAASINIVPMYNFFIDRYIKTIVNIGDRTMLTALGMNLYSSIGSFNSFAFFVLLFILALLVPYFLSKTKSENIKPPYMCGENTNDIRGVEFISTGDVPQPVIVHNYYFQNIFGENNLTLIVNIIAVAIIFVMFGVVIPHG